MSLFCCVCIYVPPKDGKMRLAWTIVNGYAVCGDHIGYVPHGPAWTGVIEAARREQPDREGT